jgi:hypothetical protein
MVYLLTGVTNPLLSVLTQNMDYSSAPTALPYILLPLHPPFVVYALDLRNPGLAVYCVAELIIQALCSSPMVISLPRVFFLSDLRGYMNCPESWPSNGGCRRILIAVHRLLSQAHSSVTTYWAYSFLSELLTQSAPFHKFRVVIPPSLHCRPPRLYLIY